MGFRYFDWQCTECGGIHDDLVNVPHGEAPPKHAEHTCPWCQMATPHDRLISCPAPYMGEKVMNVAVHGGKFDTMGHKALPPLPQLPNKFCADQAKDLFNSPHYKSVQRERNEIAKENKMKQRRAAAIRRGENINMRRDKLPGDPKITA